MSQHTGKVGPRILRVDLTVRLQGGSLEMDPKVGLLGGALGWDTRVRRK